MYTGIGSYFNSDCNPNTIRVNIGKKMLLIASKNIKKGRINFCCYLNWLFFCRKSLGCPCLGKTKNTDFIIPVLILIWQCFLFRKKIKYEHKNMLRIRKAAGDCGDQSAEEKNSTTYFSIREIQALLLKICEYDKI